ncbi:unnamed protein product, partial [marine sediment metagenome]
MGLFLLFEESKRPPDEGNLALPVQAGEQIADLFFPVENDLKALEDRAVAVLGERFEGLGYKSTGTRRQDLALEVVQEALARGGGSLDSLRLYALPFFIRDTCPRTQHLSGEGKETGNRHLREQRRILERYVLTDPLADKPLAEITRGDVVTFRALLLDKLSGKFRTVNKTLGVLKTIFGEAVYREDLRSNPAQGIGNTKYRVLKSGILTLEELLRLFPSDTLKPWKDLTDY